MRNSLFILTSIALTFFMTSCSKDADLVGTNDSVDVVTDVDPETGILREINIADLTEDTENEAIDLSEIIEKDMAENKDAFAKGHVKRIFSHEFYTKPGKYGKVYHYKTAMYSCTPNYRVRVTPISGDPDVGVWGYDGSLYNPWRKLRGVTSRFNGGGEITWYNKCWLKFGEEKVVVGIRADQNRAARYRVDIDRIYN